MTFTQIGGLISLGMLLLGGYLLVSGIRTVRRAGLRRRTWRSYPGEVVGSRLDGEQTRCQIGYRRSDGTKVVFWNSFTSTVVRNPVGRPVLVLENPADPHEAVVGGGIVSGDLVGTIFAVIGGVLAVVGVLVGTFVLRR
ncbi:DUF3592 domain-containing protein [Microlunatus flavus]|uniref:DUF3592 domain-containing protein n=1 Tax=Microlunatus flavus TaxID=1036181 RepID=A0A1H9N4S6_9ACTN|nr:DUF3592 domain-containing protein [Microlunatus flavus]SER30767.1 Protein of unknown function [Microlunatus flavus]